MLDASLGFVCLTQLWRRCSLRLAGLAGLHAQKALGIFGALQPSLGHSLAEQSQMQRATFFLERETMPSAGPMQDGPTFNGAVDITGQPPPVKSFVLAGGV